MMNLVFARYVLRAAMLGGLFPSVWAASVTVSLPSSVPSYNIIKDNFVGISLEFNVLDYLSKSIMLSTVPQTLIALYMSSRAQSVSNPFANEVVHLEPPLPNLQ